jgi:hypothetical protein
MDDIRKHVTISNPFGGNPKIQYIGNLLPSIQEHRQGNCMGLYKGMIKPVLINYNIRIVYQKCTWVKNLLNGGNLRNDHYFVKTFKISKIRKYRTVGF